MGGQVIHHDDVAWPKGLDENLLDVGPEGLGIHRPVEDHGCYQARKPERAREGSGFPVSVRNRGAAATPAKGTTTQARHLGGRAGFIDEDQTRRIEVGLGVEPVLSVHGDVWPFLLTGMRRFFEDHLVAAEEAPDRARREGVSEFLCGRSYATREGWRYAW